MTNERIIEISDLADSDDFEGYVVKTTKQNIRLSIRSGQQCCENYGHFWCNDDVKDFIGAELLGIGITDTELNAAKLMENGFEFHHRYFEGDVLFVNLETDKGTLQFVAYNEHNGYYGHLAKIESTQLKLEKHL